MATVAAARRCKTEYCPNLANERYDRGPYAGLCVELCIPAKREQLSADGVARRAARAGVAPSPHAEAEPEPAPSPSAALALAPAPELEQAPVHLPAPIDPVGESPSFADVAEELEASLEDRQRAEARYAAALERFEKHPVFVTVGEDCSWDFGPARAVS